MREGRLGPWACLLVACACVPALAGPARLVRDLGPGLAQPSSSPRDFQRMGSHVWFAAGDFVHGHELWHTDGTAAGTRLVMDLRPGPNSSGPVGLTPFGTRLAFAATLDSAEWSTWVTDGTPSGTVRLGPSVMYPGVFELPWITPDGGRVFFVGQDAARGTELWVSSGAEGDAVLVKDIWPGLGSSSPSGLVMAGGLLYFAADDGVSGRELWASDGTESGTRRVADINPGAPGSLVLQPGSQVHPALTRVGASVFLMADDGVAGIEPWTSDGTPAGTRRLADLQPGPAGSALDSSTPAAAFDDGRVVFAASDGLAGSEPWIIDIGTGVASLILDVRPGPLPSLADHADTVRGFTRLGSLACFAADDGTSGVEPWCTDGTAPGTALLGDLAAGSASSNPDQLREQGAEAWLVARIDGSQFHWLHRVDLAGRVVTLVSSLPVTLHTMGQPPRHAALDAAVVHAGIDSIGDSELYLTAGAPPTSSLLLDIEPTAGGDAPYYITPLSNGVVFHATNVQQPAVWASDGTAAGTVVLHAPASLGSSAWQGIRPLGTDIALYGAHVGALGTEPWRTDGTPAGTLPIEVAPGAESSWPQGPIALGAEVLVAANGALVGTEPVLLDAVSGTSTLVKDIKPGPASSMSEIVATCGALDGHAYFFADDGISGRELWRSDGTEAGTTQVHDGVPGPGSMVASTCPLLGVVGGRLVYTAWSPDSGYEVWGTDGTDAGTQLVADINPGFADGVHPSECTSRAVVGGIAYFMATDGSTGYELWRSDGTSAGTWRVSDIEPGAGSSGPWEFKAYGNRLFFSAYTTAQGREPWISDGSESGTRQLADIIPGRDSSLPDSALPVDGLLLFAATDIPHGREFWLTDGTSAGTRMAVDVEPGPRGSNLVSLARWRDLVFFDGTSVAAGAELWVLDLLEDADADTVPDWRAGESSSNGDADADGVPDAEDVDPANPDAWRVPGAVEGVRLTSDGRLTWDDASWEAGPAVVYDVVSGPLIGWTPATPHEGATCLADDLAVPAFDTPSGSAWFLVRSDFPPPIVASGSYGDSSASPDPRDLLDAASPCP